MGKRFSNIGDRLEKRDKRLWRTLEKEKPSSTYQYKEKKYRTTLDIDKNNRDFISRVITKILVCKNNISMEVSNSSFKGVHIILFCKKECDICRIVYDDFRRLAYDLNRPEYARNILFQKKERL